MPDKNCITLIVDLDENSSNTIKCWAIADELLEKYRSNSIILSSSPGIHITIQAGVHSEYFPCYSSNGFDYGLWNRWLELRILELCGAYGVGRIIYVGDRPPTGLLSAFDGLFLTRSVWVKGDGTKPGSAVSDLAIHFDRVYEESASPAKRGMQVPKKGIFDPLPPIIQRRRKSSQGAKAAKTRASENSPGKRVLLQMSFRLTPSSRQVYEFAHLLVREDPQLELHIQVSDPEFLVYLANTGTRTEKHLLTAETIRKFDFVILESSDAASIGAILSAGVPAIIMRGNPLRGDRNAEFVAKEKVALVHDPAIGLQPKKAKAILRRIEAVRKRLYDFALASGTEVLCRDLENANVVA